LLVMPIGVPVGATLKELSVPYINPARYRWTSKSSGWMWAGRSCRQAAGMGRAAVGTRTRSGCEIAPPPARAGLGRRTRRVPAGAAGPTRRCDDPSRSSAADYRGPTKRTVDEEPDKLAQLLQDWERGLG
jgi:hypothetical protein